MLPVPAPRRPVCSAIEGSQDTSGEATNALAVLRSGLATGQSWIGEQTRFEQRSHILPKAVLRVDRIRWRYDRTLLEQPKGGRIPSTMRRQQIGACEQPGSD